MYSCRIRRGVRWGSLREVPKPQKLSARAAEAQTEVRAERKSETRPMRRLRSPQEVGEGVSDGAHGGNRRK
jgi:hypothetical protein